MHTFQILLSQKVFASYKGTHDFSYVVNSLMLLSDEIPVAVSIHLHVVDMYDQIHLWAMDACHINRIPIRLVLYITRQ